jgi:hypothetical protein
MNPNQMAVRAALAAAAIILQISLFPASASAEVTQIRVPISFTLTPEDCPNLQGTVEGSGELFVVMNEQTSHNGVTRIIANYLATGTATDDEGATYVFNYHLHDNIRIPPEVFPVTVLENDHFNLVGKGKANHLHVGFVVRVVVSAPDQFTVEFVNERGLLACDPI